MCTISVLNVQTHRHLLKLQDMLGVGEKCYSSWSWKVFFINGFTGFGEYNIYVWRRNFLLSKSQFHCFLSCLILSYQCSYALFQASDQASHVGIAGGFLTKNPENRTSTIRPTKRKFTKFKVIRKSQWDPYATNVTWVMVWWPLCNLCNAIGILFPFSLFSPFMLCKLSMGNFSERNKYVKWSSFCMLDQNLYLFQQTKYSSNCINCHSVC